MMKNSFKDTIEFVGLSYKKEILKIVLINIASLGGIAILYFVFDYLIYVIVAAIALMAIDYLLLSRYKDKKNLILKAREDELIAIISYFEIYLQNKNNVYQSFNLLIPFYILANICEYPLYCLPASENNHSDLNCPKSDHQNLNLSYTRLNVPDGVFGDSSKLLYLSHQK